MFLIKTIFKAFSCSPDIITISLKSTQIHNLLIMKNNSDFTIKIQ
ncbi:hypothetical protein HMPREF0208_03530 [Citrobacter koseri]|nr:hypothetical protein HMPREF0208_03530 [Citrobacter koseri]